MTPTLAPASAQPAPGGGNKKSAILDGYVAQCTKLSAAGQKASTAVSSMAAAAKDGAVAFAGFSPGTAAFGNQLKKMIDSLDEMLGLSAKTLSPPLNYSQGI